MYGAASAGSLSASLQRPLNAKPHHKNHEQRKAALDARDAQSTHEESASALCAVVLHGAVPSHSLLLFARQRTPRPRPARPRFRQRLQPSSSSCCWPPRRRCSRIDSGCHEAMLQGSHRAIQCASLLAQAVRFVQGSYLGHQHDIQFIGQSSKLLPGA